MQCDITIADDNQYAHVRVKEDIVPAVARALLAEMIDLQEEKSIFRFLLDARGVSARTTPLDDFHMANREVTSAGFSAGTQVAVLKSPGDISHDFFIEIAGGIRGRTSGCSRI